VAPILIKGNLMRTTKILLNAAGAAVASANNASAYNAGVAAGVTAASVPMATAVAVAAPVSYPVGNNYASLPPLVPRKSTCAARCIT